MPEGDPSTPKQIGKCRILGRLGYGKTSTIFRAFYEPLQKEVAVKVLRPSAQASEELRAKFLGEARAIAQLDHENIVKVFDVVEESGHLLIIMELLKGLDLFRLVRQEGPIEAERAVEIVTQAGRALQAAHQQQIIHRDVKPHNLMVVGRRDKVKLVDFGLAIAGGVAGKAGTPHFMSPEQIRGKRIEEKSDIYSLGATLFFLLTGRPPYPGETRQEILDRHLEGKIPSASRAAPDLDIPRSIDPIVKRMMAPVPGYRHTARDLVAALEDLNLQARTAGRRAQTGRAAARRARSGPPVGLLFGGLGLLAAVVVVAVLLLTGGDKKKARQAAKPETPVVQPAQPDKPVEPSIQDRQQERQRRMAEAERLLNEAKAFERDNEDDYEAVFARYKSLWDEYGDTGPGQAARGRMKELEDEHNSASREADLARQQEARRQARSLLIDEVRQLMAGLKFAEVQKLIESFMLTHGEDSVLMEKFNRLGWAGICLETLAAAINSNQRKLPLRLIRDGAPRDAVIESADANGVTVKEGESVRVERWFDLKPKEIERLASRQIGYRNPKKAFYVHCLCAELGLEREAETWKTTAISRDETGEIQRLFESLKGGWKRGDQDR